MKQFKKIKCWFAIAILGVCSVVHAKSLPILEQSTLEQSNIGQSQALPEGVYDGDIESGNHTLRAQTHFLLSNGRLSGDYVMHEETRIVEGVLTHCEYEQTKRQLTCRWHDIYGAGWVVMNFSEKFEHFNGLWYSKGYPKYASGKWQGQKSERANEQSTTPLK